MRTNRIMTAILGVAIASSACATKSGTGTAVGGIGGAVVGGAIGGTGGALVGGALGSILGYGVGRQIEKEDARRAQAAIEANRRAAWSNNGNYYEVTPTDTMMRSGRECREFTMVHTDPDGHTNRGNGIACRQSDGNWEIQS
jgi:surface antigen